MLFLSAQWLKDIGADKGFYSKLPSLVEQDAEKIRKKLIKHLEITEVGVIATKEKVQKSLKKFKESDVDVVIACYLTWGEDWLLLEAVKRLSNIPFLIWCYTPFHKLELPFDMNDLFRGCGVVGAVQGSGPLKRMRKNFGFVFGSVDNETTIKEIISYSKVAQLIGTLRMTTVGLLPSTCEYMSGTHVDESILKAQIGPEVKTISVEEYYALSQKVSEEEIKDYVEEIKENYEIKVEEKALLKGVRASLGLARVVEENNLKALALQDLSEELHQVFGLRPCLYVPSFFEKAVVSMEGDVGAAVALLILKELTGEPPLYTEIFIFDEKENTIVAGHAGIHDISLADDKKKIRITPDYEYMEVETDTAWMQFKAKGGKVTLLSLFCDVDGFNMIISSGTALADDREFDISSYMHIKLDIPLERFFSQIMKMGMTQHWAVVHEDIVDELEYLAELLNLNRITLDADERRS